jgi:tetratricopeptide (TPR) repeat protein
LESLSSGYTFPEPLPLLREKFDRLSDLEIRIGDEEEDSPSLLVAAQEVALEHPDLATAHLLLAQAYFFTEDYHNADIAAYRSQELDPEIAEAHLILFLSRAGKEQWDDATESASYLLQHWPDDADFRDLVITGLNEFPDGASIEGLLQEAVKPARQTSAVTVAKIRLAMLKGNEASVYDQIVELIKSDDFDLSLMETILGFGEGSPVSLPLLRGVLYPPLRPKKLIKIIFPIGKKALTKIPKGKRISVMSGVGRRLLNEDVLLYVDDTALLLPGNKEGLILTPTRMIWKEAWEEPLDVRYDSITDLHYKDEDEGEDLSTIIIETKGSKEPIHFMGLDDELRRCLFKYLAVMIA